MADASQAKLRYNDNNTVIMEYNSQHLKDEKIPKVDMDRKLIISWPFVAIFTVLHVMSVAAIYYIFKGVMWQSLVFNAIYGKISQLGITIGAHRLYTHRSFKAKLPTRIGLMLAFTSSFQGTFIKWCRDHRLHHKYTDSEPDPYNSSRGFFYSHFWWLCVKKGKLTVEKGKQMDMSDLWDDPVVRFQHNHYFTWLMPLMAFVLPVLICVYGWNEPVLPALCLSVLRHITFLHITSLVNSAAHIYGYRPYDKALSPGDHKLISLLVSGEAFHNYHHVFPSDYKTSELPEYFINIGALIIELLAEIGQVYDLKTASKDVIDKRSSRTGDGTREYVLNKYNLL